MKKIIIILGVLVLVLVSCLYVTNYEEPHAKNINCNNFNGRDFIFTGGSQHPQTNEEIVNELSRLNWLCNGGSKR